MTEGHRGDKVLQSSQCRTHHWREDSYFIQIFIWTVESVSGISIPCISVIQLFKLKTSC